MILPLLHHPLLTRKKASDYSHASCIRCAVEDHEYKNNRSKTKRGNHLIWQMAPDHSFGIAARTEQ